MSKKIKEIFAVKHFDSTKELEEWQLDEPRRIIQINSVPQVIQADVEESSFDANIKTIITVIYIKEIK